MLGLLAETSLHAGAGQMAGVVDLPIQREAHTGWPVVYGSAVKGALRARAEDIALPAPERTLIFGPETTNAHEHAGALLVSDARLLLLPVRSLTSHFKWVTCPALLKRFLADANRLGAPAFAAEAIPTLAEAGVDTAWLPTSMRQAALYLEEFRFEPSTSDLDAIITALAELMGRPDAAEALRQQLVIVHDDRFRHLAEFAIPVNAHVCIDNASKTVNPGALWYEESLPPDTLLYCGLHAQNARAENSEMSAAQVLEQTTRKLFEQPYLQLGGNETVGMGWCKVTIHRSEAQHDE